MRDCFSIKFLLFTIPPSRPCRATSLYTREAMVRFDSIPPARVILSGVPTRSRSVILALSGLALKVRQAQDDTFRCPSGRSRTAKQHRAKRRWNLGRIFSYTSRSCHGENFKKARFREKKRENESFDISAPPRETKGARGESGTAGIAFDKTQKKCYNITVHKRNSCKTREP